VTPLRARPSGSAIVVGRLLTGPAPDFIVTKVALRNLATIFMHRLGVIAGLLGVVYITCFSAPSRLPTASRTGRWKFVPRWLGRRSERSHGLRRA